MSRARRRIRASDEVLLGHTHISQHLPVELLVHILLFIPSYVESWEQRVDGRSSVLKDGLTRASLTCRYWATKIRPFLFSEILLRDSEDVSELLTLLGSPPIFGRRLSTYIHEITYLKASNYVPPWTRLTLLSKLITGVKIRIDTGYNLKPQPLDGCAFIHCLPRTLPPGAFPPLSEMRLRGVKFRNRMDSLRLISTFPRLGSYTSASNDFYALEPPSQYHPIVTRLRERRRFELWYHALPVNSRVPPTYLGYSLDLASAAVSGQQALGIADDAWEILYTALIALIPSNRRVQSLCVEKLDSGEEYLYMSIAVEDDKNSSMSNHVRPNSTTLIWLYSLSREPAAASNSVRGIRRIRIDLSTASQAPLHKSSLWNAFETKLLGLPSIPEVELVIGMDRVLLTSILRGIVLSKIDRQHRLVLFEQAHSPGVTTRDVLAEPEERLIKGHKVKLSLVGRFYLLARKDKEKY